MKNASVKSLSLAAMLSLIAFSCQKEKEIVTGSAASDDNTALVPEITTLDNNVYDIMYSPDVQASSADAETMTSGDGISAIVEFDNDFDDESSQYSTRASKHCNLSNLKLTEKQITALRRANREYEACKKSAIQRLRQINKTILERAEKRRLELLEAYKNGRITKAQLQRALEELRAKVKAELANLHERRLLAQAIQKCHNHFLRAVHNILTKDQWNIWVRCRLERFDNKH